MTLFSKIFKIAPWIQLYENSFAIILAFIFGIILIIFDRKPPQFPLPINEPAIDCGNLEVTSIVGEYSRIKLQLKVQNFLQYPPKISPNLIRIQVWNGKNNVLYSSKEFWDLERSNDNVSFCVLHTLNGDVHVNVFCQNERIKSAKIHIPSVPIYPVGWSNVESYYDRTASFTDICYANHSFIYSIQSTNYSLLNISAGQDLIIPINVTTQGRAHIEHLSNATYIENTTVFLSTTSNESYMQILEAVLPLWALIATRNPTISSYSFIKDQDFLESAIQPILPNAKRIDLNFTGQSTYTSTNLSNSSINSSKKQPTDDFSFDFDENDPKNLSNYCFGNAEFIFTTGASPYTEEGDVDNIPYSFSLYRQINWIQSYSPSIIPSLRQIYLNLKPNTNLHDSQIVRNRIVLSPNVAKSISPQIFHDLFYEPHESSESSESSDSSENSESSESSESLDNESFSNEKQPIYKIKFHENELEFIVLTDDMDVPTTVQIVSTANVLIVTDVAESVLAAFLEPNKASVIEIQPKGSWCNHFAKDFVQLSNSRYFSLYNDPQYNDPEYCQIHDIYQYYEARKSFGIIDEDQLRSVICQALDLECNSGNLL